MELRAKFKMEDKMFRWRDKNGSTQQDAIRLEETLKKLYAEKGSGQSAAEIVRLQKEVDDIRSSLLIKEQAVNPTLQAIPYITLQNADQATYDAIALHKELVTFRSTVVVNQNSSLALRHQLDEKLTGIRTSSHDPAGTLAQAKEHNTAIAGVLSKVEQYNTALSTHHSNLEIFKKGLQDETTRQLALDTDSSSIARSQKHSPLTPPNVQIMRAKSIPATELIYTKFFDEISKRKNTDAFDIALKRVPNVNAKNSDGITTLTYVSQNMFEHGIKELLKRGALTSDTFLFLFKGRFNEATKLLIKLVGPISGYDEVFSGLTGDTTVTHLNLSGTSLTPAAIGGLATALKQNKTVVYLDLSQNHLGEAGSEQIGELLLANKKITTLKLMGVNLKDNLGIDCVHNIAEALTVNTTLEELDVSKSSIPYDGGIAIARMLAFNKGMKALDIANNNIEDVGIFYLVNDLMQNKHLASLNISGNGVSDEGAAAIAQWLADECSVARIKMENNTKIGPTGVKLITDAILANNSIIEFTGVVDLENKIAEKISQNLASYRQKLEYLTQNISLLGSASFKELFILYQQINSNIENFNLEQEQGLFSKISAICQSMQVEEHRVNDEYASVLIANFEHMYNA